MDRIARETIYVIKYIYKYNKNIVKRQKKSFVSKFKLYPYIYIYVYVHNATVNCSHVFRLELQCDIRE